MMRFEHRSKPLLPRPKFFMRVGRYALVSLLLIVVSLLIGVVGYHYLNDLGWLDALVNASMILTGMGPVDPLKNDAAKWFASIYSIFSGVAFLSIMAVLLAPIAHRFLHRLHVADDD